MTIYESSMHLKNLKEWELLGPNASMEFLEHKGVFNVKYYFGKGLQCFKPCENPYLYTIFKVLAVIVM